MDVLLHVSTEEVIDEEAEADEASTLQVENIRRVDNLRRWDEDIDSEEIGNQPVAHEYATSTKENKMKRNENNKVKYTCSEKGKMNEETFTYPSVSFYSYLSTR